MRGAVGLIAFLLVAPQAGPGAAEDVGTPPRADLSFHDLPKAFALPALKDSPEGPLGRDISHLQVIARARSLGLTTRSATEAWRKAGALLSAARFAVELARQAPSAGEIAFAGARASELNMLMRTGPSNLRVRLTGPRLLMDEPLRLDRNGARLDLGTAKLVGSDPRQPYIIRIEHARDVTLLGGVFSGVGGGVLVSGAQGVLVADGRYDELSGEGVVVTDARDVVVWGGRFTRLGRAGIVLHGTTTASVVAYNDIHDDLGASNWNAGVVVTDRNVDMAADPLSLLGPDHYGVVPQPIPGRIDIPHGNLIAANRIAHNRASGMYFDGASENVVAANDIQGNAKEGMCLDNGSTANVVALNAIQQNGERWGSSDEDLRRDFIAGFGRMPNGSAVAKVPGLSLDNAAYNLVYDNEINGNYGGGVKMVRTAYFNIIGLNTIVDNNMGQSDRFHFFGVELGAASADTPVPDLDFTPSRGNVLFSNLIRGSHYAGVFFAPGSDLNDLFDNAIFGATNWAIESARRQNNSTLNNLTNLHSRNASPGLDPRLPELTSERDD